MQNAEITESKEATNKDYLDTREVKVSSEVADASSEKKAKVKRSRFSVALRSLSLTRSKKETNKEPRSLPVSLDIEPTFSSGGEDSFDSASTDSKPKKKSKLSRRFLLGNLKKSKVYQKGQESDNTPLDKSTTVGTSKKDQTKNEEISDGNVEADKYAKHTTVQITISGKKVEPSRSSGGELKRKGASSTQTASAVSETDYLTPLTTSAAATLATVTKTTETTTAAIAGKGSRTTKVIVSKVGTAPVKETSAQSSPAPSSSPFPAKAVAATLVAKSKKLKSKKASTLTTQPTKTEVTAEKIVITQSTQDTPPPERAPIKPSRVTSTPIASQTSVSSNASQTGAVRKPTTKIAASNTLPSQSKHLHTTSSKKSLKSVATVAVTAVSSRREREINAQQRGHRISRPTTTQTTQPSARSSLKAEATKQQPRESTPQIQLQTETHGSSEHTLPPTPPYKQTQSSLLQANVIYQASSSIQDNLTSEVQTLENQRHSSENENTNEADAISSAESAQPTEYAHCSLKEELATAAGSRSISPATSFPVHFAVGSAVRPLTAPSAYDAAGAAALASAVTQELSSSDSQSESSLRRIRYQTQSTLCGDHDSVQGRRETLHYHSVANDSSNDTEEYDSGDPPMPAFGDLTMDQEMEPTIMTSTSEKREHLYKILVIGELGTGKTSFIKRYVHQFFSQNYRATIGVDFALKVLHWDPNTIVRLQLWDIAGQERFGNMTRVYYKEAVGAFIVFDVTRSGTFDCVTKWKEDLDSKVQLPDGNPIPCILLANKCDQDKQGVVTLSERMDEYVHENGFAGWFETSAKENINIDEAARALVNKILLNDKLISDTDLADSDNKFNLNNPDNTTHADVKSKCAC